MRKLCFIVFILVLDSFDKNGYFLSKARFRLVMRIFGIEIGVVCHIIKFLYKFEGVMEGEEGETV